MLASIVGVALLTMAICQANLPGSFPAVGNYWVILGAALTSGGYLALLLALSAQLYGVAQGYRLLTSAGKRLLAALSLERLLAAGALLIGGGLLMLLTVLWRWQERHFGPTDSILSAVLGTTLITLGCQTIMGGFLLAILGGNIARFNEFRPSRT
jgi:hypothetical protein